MAHNPYAAPTADLLGKTSEMLDMERIRNEHLKHETNIRGIGGLFVLGGILVTFVTAFPLLALIQKGEADLASELGVSFFVLILGIIQLSVGVGLYRYRPVARIPGAILSGLSMINIPLGTLIGGYFLYTLVSAKGKYVFTPEYQQIRAATPHVKLKSSLLSKIILVLLLVALVGLIAAFALK